MKNLKNAVFFVKNVDITKKCKDKIFFRFLSDKPKWKINWLYELLLVEDSQVLSWGKLWKEME